MNNETVPTNEIDTDPPGDRGHPQRWKVLWVLCGSLVLVVVSVSSLNVAIPPIQRSLDATGSELQWIIDSYALVFAGLLLPAGAIGDRYGRREALLGGLVVFGAASLGGMLAGTATQLIIWRGLMGVGAAFIMPATLSIIATVFGAAERPRAIAIWAGFAGAGGAIGLLSSGLLLRWFWWGSVFAVNLPLVAIMIAAVTLLVPTSRDPEATSLDPVGAVLSIVGLVALVFAIIEGPEAGWSDPRTTISFGVSVLALAAFVVWELRIEHPMLDPRFFRNRRFSLGSLTITVAFFGIFGMFFVLTQFLQFVQGHDALAAALRILPYGLTLLVVAPRAATLAQRYGSRVVMTVGMVVAASGFATIGQLRPDSAYLIALVGMLLVATGTGLLMPPATSALVASLPPAKAGVGSAMNDTTREVGGAVGIAVVGALISVGYRDGIEDATQQLDAESAEQATDSLGGLLRIADELEPGAAQNVIEAGRSAFTDGMQLGMLTAAALLIVTAGFVALLHPSNDNETEEST